MFMWGAFGFQAKSHVTKKGFIPLAFLSMAILRAMFTITLRALQYSFAFFLVQPNSKHILRTFHIIRHMYLVITSLKRS
jgi:hypothetical protein